MMQEIIDRITEMIVKGRLEYTLECLEKMGYSREYVRENQLDFIPVRFPYVESFDALSCVVLFPEERCLFWFRERTELMETGSGCKLVIEQFDEALVPDELRQNAQECARQARRRALDLSTQGVSRMSLLDVL